MLNLPQRPSEGNTGIQHNVCTKATTEQDFTLKGNRPRPISTVAEQCLTVPAGRSATACTTEPLVSIGAQKRLCKSCSTKKTCVWKHFPEEINRPCLSYLESNAQKGGGLSRNEAYSQSINRASMCKTTHVELESELEETFFMPIDCKKFWCPDCGGKNGKIHHRRLGNVLDRIIFDGHFLRQFVFTIPIELRNHFQDREMLNAFIALVNRIIEKEFSSDIWQVDYLHLFGDGQAGTERRFHPHVNVHVLDGINKSWKLSPERLDRIRMRYRKALTALLGLKQEIAVCDVHYSYRVGKGKMMHAVRYMSRPFDVDILDHISEELQHFLVLDLKGFQYLRYLKMAKGKKNEKMLSDEASAAVGEQFEGMVSPVTGSPLRVVRFLTAERFEMLSWGRTIKKHPNGLLSIGDDDDVS